MPVNPDIPADGGPVKKAALRANFEAIRGELAALHDTADALARAVDALERRISVLEDGGSGIDRPTMAATRGQPAADLGTVGDTALDFTNGQIWEKTANGWEAVGYWAGWADQVPI